MQALATADRLGLTRYVSQQIEYSLRFRDSEDELLPLGLNQGIGALIWGPLAGAISLANSATAAIRAARGWARRVDSGTKRTPSRGGRS